MRAPVQEGSPFEAGSEQFDQEIQPVVSIAISLKRIADAISETNEYGEGPAAAIGGHRRPYSPLTFRRMEAMTPAAHTLALSADAISDERLAIVQAQIAITACRSTLQDAHAAMSTKINRDMLDDILVHFPDSTEAWGDTMLRSLEHEKDGL